MVCPRMGGELPTGIRPSEAHVSLLQGWEFDLKWRPKGGETDIWKLKNVKFSVLSPPPILRQTIDSKHLDAMRFLISIIQ